MQMRKESNYLQSGSCRIFTFLEFGSKKAKMLNQKQSLTF